MSPSSWFSELCGTNLMPHGNCYLWNPGLVWLHVLSDGAISLAYFSIPLALVTFARRKAGLPYPFLFWLFGAFIVACGTSHLLEVTTVWVPLYWLSGAVKAVTALLSAVTAIVLIRILPEALELPGPNQLREINTALEERVRLRTTDLERANTELQNEILQRREAQAEIDRLNHSLRNRLAEMQALFELLPIGVGIAESADCKDIRTNKEFARMLALDRSSNASLTAPENEAPKNFRVFTSGRECAPEDLPMQVAARENRPVLDVEELIERSDGVRIHVIANAVPLRDEEGRSRGSVGTFLDVTEHKNYEDELRLVVDAAPNAMIRTDARGTITLVNTQAELLFGYSRNELLGQSIEILVPDRFKGSHPQRRGHFFGEPSARVMGAGRELFGRRIDGSEVAIEIGLNPIKTAKGLTVIASIIDITERKRSEQHQRDLDHKLLETQKLESLGVLAGGIAHDFNNLLTGIIGNTSLIAEELSPSSTVQPILTDVENAAQRAADLCRQMLAYAGKGRFVVKEINLNELIEETTHLLSISVGKNCVTRFNLAAAIPAILADATQIRQIIMNLVINASEAIGERSGVIAVSTGVVRVDHDYLATLNHSEGINPGDFVYLEVSDNGCGMSAATISRIFDPFFTTKFTGRGLGLAAVLGIIRGHKGALKVYSEVDRGTTFKILLPCVDAKVPAGASRSPLPPTQWHGSGNVLVVDDEETVRTVAARILERKGFTVELVADGRDAVERFRSDVSRYTLVLLDLTMPHLDGEETFRQLRHLNPGIQVILMSGFNQQEAVSRFTGKGLAGFIQKPFVVETVLAEVRRVMLKT